MKSCSLSQSSRDTKNNFAFRFSQICLKVLNTNTLQSTYYYFCKNKKIQMALNLVKGAL